LNWCWARWNQVEQQAHPGDVGHAGPDAVELPGRQACQAQLAGHGVPQRVDAEEHRQAHETEAMDQCVDHVVAHGGMVGDRLDGPAALEQADAQQDDADLHDAEQQPAGCVVGILQQVAEPQAEDDGLHDVLVQRQLQAVEGVGDPVDHGFLGGDANNGE
jgi:hypothetical protein